MNNKHTKLTVSASPHIVSGTTTKSLMFDVVIALMPLAVFGACVFGMRSAVLTAVSVLSCVSFEYLYCLITKKPTSIGDLSAVVTGMLLAFNVPVTLPIWMLVIGCGFAIIVVKQIFGGIGCNFVNPALAARAFMLASWTAPMTTFVEPFSKISLFSSVATDSISSATPLALLKVGDDISQTSLLNVFFGNVGGCIGEISAFLILAGGAFLIIKKVISWKIPVVFIGTFAVLTYFFGERALSMEFVLLSVMSGGLMLGAFFMATDYTTTPTTPMGMIYFAIGCGVITFVIRRFGGYPEGVTYAILLMNIAAPLIERSTIPKVFGGVKIK